VKVGFGEIRRRRRRKGGIQGAKKEVASEGTKTAKMIWGEEDQCNVVPVEGMDVRSSAISGFPSLELGSCTAHVRGPHERAWSFRCALGLSRRRCAAGRAASLYTYGKPIRCPMQNFCACMHRILSELCTM
jgi:hypothetical protein